MKNKNIKKKSSGDENQFGMILEHIDAKIDLLLEGQKSLEKRIEALENRFKDFELEINYKFEAVFEELHLIKNKLNEKVSRDEFRVLEKRMSILEKRVAAKLK